MLMFLSHSPLWQLSRYSPSHVDWVPFVCVKLQKICIFCLFTIIICPLSLRITFGYMWMFSRNDELWVSAISPLVVPKLQLRPCSEQPVGVEKGASSLFLPGFCAPHCCPSSPKMAWNNPTFLFIPWRSLLHTSMCASNRTGSFSVVLRLIFVWISHSFALFLVASVLIQNVTLCNVTMCPLKPNQPGSALSRLIFLPVCFLSSEKMCIMWNIILFWRWVHEGNLFRSDLQWLEKVNKAGSSGKPLISIHGKCSLSLPGQETSWWEKPLGD